MKSKRGKSGGEAFSAILNGLGKILERIESLPSEVRREGSAQGPAGSKEIRGIYGFTFKVGLGGEGLEVEPFGNAATESEAKSPVTEVREPAVDVFDEDSGIVVVAEMPGIAVSDVDVEVQEDVLILAAARGEKRYRKEVLLPRAVEVSKMSLSGTNGVFEVRFPA